MEEERWASHAAKAQYSRQNRPQAHQQKIMLMRHVPVAHSALSPPWIYLHATPRTSKAIELACPLRALRAKRALPAVGLATKKNSSNSPAQGIVTDMTSNLPERKGVLIGRSLEAPGALEMCDLMLFHGQEPRTDPTTIFLRAPNRGRDLARMPSTDSEGVRCTHGARALPNPQARGTSRLPLQLSHI